MVRLVFASLSFPLLTSRSAVLMFLGRTRRFEESLKLAQLVPTDIYRFPSPPFTTTLRDGTSSKPFADRLHSYWLSRLSSSASSSSIASTPTPTANTATNVILGGVSPALCTAAETDSYLRQFNELDAPSSAFRSHPAEGPPLSTHSASSTSNAAHSAPAPKPSRSATPIFADKKVYLASDLGLSYSLERALKGAIEAAGGSCWSFGIDGEEEATELAKVEGRSRGGENAVGGRRTDAFAKRKVAERRLRECGLVIMRTREGWEYWTVCFFLSPPCLSLPCPSDFGTHETVRLPR